MSFVVNLLDQYERRARFYPMLLVLMPAVLGLASWLPMDVDAPGFAGSIVLGVALAAFLSQLARDQGRAKESELFKMWGGIPSVRAMSYSAGVFGGATVARFHRKLRELDPALDFPETAEQETEYPVQARAVYESANELLLSRTRDRGKFRLVHEENINYGYRRNLWAMKPMGLFLAVFGFTSGALRVVLEIVYAQPIGVTVLCAVILGAVLVVLWIVRVRPEWVRLAADAYAKQLVAASDTL